MQLSTILPRSLAILFIPLVCAVTLTLQVPPNIPALPPTSTAYLIAYNTSLHAPITRANTFIFPNLVSPPSDAATTASASSKTSYLLDIACRDYDFASYGVDVKSNGVVELYRVARGGIDLGERVTVGQGPVQLRVLKAKEYYDSRSGFDPLSMLKNPMVLIGVVGLAFVVGMPYLMDNMDPEMKKEFEEQQKKGIMGSGGASAANPIANFDMAAWMAGKTASPAASTGQDHSEDARGGSGSRRRG